MLDTKELAGHLDILLQRMCTSLYRQKEQYAEETNISRQQFEVLNVIYERGKITMGELCKEISSACSTATDLGDRLEKAGYVERIREKRDRRVVRLSILPTGEKLVKSVIESRKEKIAEVLDSFDENEQKKLISFLESLVDRIERF